MECPVDEDSLFEELQKGVLCPEQYRQILVDNDVFFKTMGFALTMKFKCMMKDIKNFGYTKAIFVSTTKFAEKMSTGKPIELTQGKTEQSQLYVKARSKLQEEFYKLDMNGRVGFLRGYCNFMHSAILKSLKTHHIVRESGQFALYPYLVTCSKGYNLVPPGQMSLSVVQAGCLEICVHLCANWTPTHLQSQAVQVGHHTFTYSMHTSNFDQPMVSKVSTQAEVPDDTQPTAKRAKTDETAVKVEHQEIGACKPMYHVKCTNA